MAEPTQDISSTVREFYSYLKNYIQKKVSDPHIAEDLTQEVMYRLAVAEEEDREIRNVKAWLFQTTRHVIADYYRDKERNPVENLRDSFPTKASDLEMKKVAEADFLIPMIKLLPEKYSRPLLMSDIEELPQKEIARKLDLGLSATKMRILRARKKLRDLFTTCCHIEFDASGDFAGCTIKDHCEPLQELRDQLCSEIS
jgi:RNA polymerase sigma-70 factor (ECF subfamily)